MNQRIFLFAFIALFFFNTVFTLAQGVWIDQSTFFNGNPPYLLSISFINETTGMAVGDYGMICKTTDGGYSWTKFEAGVFTDFYGLHFSGTKAWVCGEAGKIYYSSDGGKKWNAQSSGTSVDLFDIHFTNSLSGVAVGWNNTIIYTTNGGATWSVASVPGTAQVYYKGVTIIGSTAYACGGTGSNGRAVKSTDGGATWSIVSSSFVNTLMSIKFLNANTGFIAGIDGNVYSTIDGQTFNQVTRAGGFPIMACSFVNATTGWVIGKIYGTFNWDDYGLYHTANAGQTWDAQVSPVMPKDFFGIDFVTDHAGWACGQGGAIIHYTNTPPKISSAADYDFGSLICGNTKQDTIFIRNIGLEPLNLKSVQFSGTNAGEFSLISPPQGKAYIKSRDSAQLIVRWSPVTLGSKTAILNISSNDPYNPIWNVKLTARKDSSEVKLSSLTVNFDTICLGQSAIKTITALPSGTVGSILREFVHVSGDTDFTCLTPALPANLSLSVPNPIEIEFHPDVYGSKEAVYKFKFTPCNREFLLTLRGVANRSGLQTSPDTAYNFGDVKIGQSATKLYELRANGNKASHVVSISFDPPAPGFSFIPIPSLPISFNPGEKKTYVVQFAPATVGLRQTNLKVVWDAECPDSTMTPIDGTGILSPQIAGPLSKSFTIPLCADVKIDSVKIKNTGGASLRIDDASISGIHAGKFFILSPSIPASIPPGDSVNFIIRYQDDVAGSKTASLVLTHNDAGNSPLTIYLTGQRDVASFTMYGDTVGLLETCPGASARRLLKIVNDGNVPIMVKTINVIENGDVFHFTSDSLPKSINPGEEILIEVTFMPKASGQSPGRIIITADPCGFSRELTLQGVGMKTHIQIQPMSIQFFNVRIGSSSDASIEFTNTEPHDMIIDTMYFNPPVSSLQLAPIPTYPLRIDAGNTFSTMLRYAPTTTDSIVSSVCMRAVSPCRDTICIPIEGTATRAALGVNRSRVSVTLSACTFTSLFDTIVVTNKGAATVDLTELSIIQTDSVFLLIQKPVLPLSISSQQSISLIIRADASFTGNRSGTLQIKSTDPDNQLIDVQLNARRDSSAITLSTTSLSFGTLLSCDLSKSVTWRITNSGTLAETLTADSLHDLSFVLTESFPIILQPGESKQLSIRFTPKQLRRYRDSLVLYSSVCSRVYKLYLDGERMKPSYTITPAMLDFKQVAIGSVSTITLRLTNANVLTSKWINTIVNPPFPDLNFSTSPGQDILANRYKDFDFQFRPQDTLTHTATFCFIIGAPCPDTLCIAITGQGVRGGIVTSKSLLQFGKLAQCEVQRDTIICTNTGNAPLDITASIISGVGASSFSLLNPTTSTETLNPTQTRTYFVDFHPSTALDGIVNASLAIQTTEPQRPVIDIPLRGERITQIAPIITPIDFGAVNIGETKMVQVSLRNTGSSFFCIDSMSRLPLPITIQTPLPICLQPGEQKFISLSYSPAAIETLATISGLLITTPCRDLISAQLTARSVAGGLIQTTALQYGTVASCLTKTDTITIENKYGVEAIVERIAISGIDSSLFVRVQPLSLPITIPPNGSEKIVIAFQPQAGSDGVKQAMCTTTLRIDTSMRSLVTGLSAISSTPRIDITALTFPVTSIGTNTDRVLSIMNSNPYPIVVTNVSTTDAVFTIRSTQPALPATLQPGQRIDITVRFIPVTEKMYNASLQVESNSPCSSIGAGNLSGEGKSQSITSVGASIPTLHARLDEIIQLPIFLDTDVRTAQVTSWSGDITFNRTMLYPKNVIIQNTLSENMTVASTYDHKTGTLHLSASGAPLISGKNPLVIIDFLVLLGNDVETPITISPTFDLTSGTARIVRRTNGLFQLEGYCLAGKRLIKVLGTYSLKQNHPNPFSAGIFGDPSTRIEYEIGVEGFASLIVFDAYGREVERVVQEWKTPGRYEVEFRSDELSSGIYYYILRSGQFSDVKKMVVGK